MLLFYTLQPESCSGRVWAGSQGACPQGEHFLLFDYVIDTPDWFDERRHIIAISHDFRQFLVGTSLGASAIYRFLPVRHRSIAANAEENDKSRTP